MSNTHKHHGFLKIVSASFIIAGSVLLIGSAQELKYAHQIGQLTHGGATVQVAGTPVAREVPMLKTPSSLHAAAPVDPVPSEGVVMIQLVLGMLLILFGFSFHAVLVMKDDEEIRITAVQHPKHQKKHSHRMEVFWVELQK